MKLIVGLGNPGKEYEGTRHNCGFMVVDKLAEKLNVNIDQDKFKGFNNIVDIKNTVDNNKYFCPSCNTEMILKRGQIRQWHFAHKTDKCSYDKYLHSIATRIFIYHNKKYKNLTISETIINIFI